MRIYEYEAKEVLQGVGIPVPRSILARKGDEVAGAAREIGGAVVLKPQTLIKARGKAGLIAFADTPEEAAQNSHALFGRIHHDEIVEAILVEEKVEVTGEFYLGIVIDYADSRPVMIASASGGVDIEEIANGNPDLVLRVSVSPSEGLTESQVDQLCRFLVKTFPDPGCGAENGLKGVITNFYRAFVNTDCEMAEINPLGIGSGGKVVALDAAMDIDEDALFRQQNFVRRRNRSEAEHLREIEYQKRGWTYLKMGGDIGILSSGAGITMAILDLMRELGGKPANFLDTAQMDRKGMYDAFKIFYGDPTIKTVLVNIFAGLNRCDDLAEGIKDFLTEHKPEFSVVVRMIGNREEEGREILKSIGIDAVSGLEDAVVKVIQVNGERQ